MVVLFFCKTFRVIIERIYMKFHEHHLTHGARVLDPNNSELMIFDCIVRCAGLKRLETPIWQGTRLHMYISCVSFRKLSGGIRGMYLETYPVLCLKFTCVSWDCDHYSPRYTNILDSIQLLLRQPFIQHKITVTVSTLNVFNTTQFLYRQNKM